MTLWEINIHPAEGQPDLMGQQVVNDARTLGLTSSLRVRAAHGYLIQGELDHDQAMLAARRLLVDSVTETFRLAPVGDAELQLPPCPDAPAETVLQVFRKPGVMDPTANSTLQALRDLNLNVEAVRTIRKYWISDIASLDLERLTQKVLANASIEQVVVGPLSLREIQVGHPYHFQKVVVPIRGLDDRSLEKLSREGQLYFSLPEMKTIQAHYAKMEREPSDIELETIAQTWSEHCSHKTLGGRIEYRDEHGTRQFQSMLKETIFAATTKVRQALGDEVWCVSVFKDNAGVVTFDDEYHVVFKVE
ncbi:MAG: phosphoribosylformylglycinamidine synthase subunit PurS, partial [Pirellulaceae bacterium]